MKASKLVFTVLVIILVMPMAGCNLIGQNPLTAIGSLVPQATLDDTVEATVDSGEATAESTPLIRPKTVATIKPKVTAVKTVAATVKPKATVKAMATKKATLAPISSASSSLPIGASIYSDDFTDPTSGWAEDSSAQSETGYLDGKYVITVYEVNYLSWSFLGQLFSDFVVEIEGAKLSGPNDGEYGILFRYVDSDHYYIFKVNAAGRYVVFAYDGGEWINLIAWTKNSAVKTGTATNKLAIVAQGETFAFYINGVKVDEMVDNRFAEGDIALVVGTHDVGDFAAGFTNIGVWEVDGVASPTEKASGSITKGAKLYSETFADSSTGWDEWDSSGKSRAAYEDGKYVLEIFAVNRMIWGNGYQDFDDFVMEVETTKLGGPDDNGFGIVFRYVDSANFYVFKASSDGQYAFGYYLDDEWTEVVPWSLTDTVIQGESTNKLSVACKGNHYILSINGKVVEDLTDDTFSSGDIGVMAASRSEAGVKVTFDNVNVWAVK
ncbi:MAG: hypothetical protein ACYCZF_16210 [Anaerolineae bacterium]